MRSLRLFSSSTTFTVPSTAGPSSSEVIRSAIEPLCEPCLARKSSTATTKAAIEVFMSAAPGPEIRHVAALNRLDRESQSCEALGQQFLATVVLRGDRAARDQLAREPERSEEHTSELQSHSDLVCRLL